MFSILNLQKRRVVIFNIFEILKKKKNYSITQEGLESNLLSLAAQLLANHDPSLNL